MSQPFGIKNGWLIWHMDFERPPGFYRLFGSLDLSNPITIPNLGLFEGRNPPCQHLRQVGYQSSAKILL